MYVTFYPGIHGATFGGKPLVYAVASEVLSVHVKESLVQNSPEIGNYFKKGLEK